MEAKEFKDNFFQNKPNKLELKNFEFGEIVGTGSFARVRISKNLINKKYFAVKCLKKIELIKMQQVDHILNEMRILNNLEHPFIIKFEGFMQDAKRLYFVEEFVNGGELFSFLGAVKKLSSEIAQFYSAHVVLIFQYMHSKNIIYRDLKPENLLIDKSGYLKLCDFGFAKYCDTGSRTYTLCGTPEYLAPEILLNKGHSKPVDWWTFGVFLYELLVGIDPFADDDPLKVYQRILKGKIKFPPNFDKKAKSLIKKLLEIDLSKRYGNLVGGANDIMTHRFYSDFSFEKLLNMELKPPYVPKVTSNYDVSNFPVYPESFKDVPNIDKLEDPFLKW